MAQGRIMIRPYIVPGWDRVGALFRFQYEAAALVQVDEVAGTLGAGHHLLEHVGVGGLVGRGGIGLGHVQHLAQLQQEGLGIGALGRAGELPLGEEGLEVGDVVGGGHGWRSDDQKIRE